MPLRLVGRCDVGRESERHDAEIRRERESICGMSALWTWVIISCQEITLCNC